MSAERRLQIRPPAPEGISEEARLFLDSQPAATTVESRTIPLDDVEGWERLIAEADAATRELLVACLPPAGSLLVEDDLIGDVRVFRIRPRDGVADEGPLFLDVHGGGLIQCGGDLAWMTSALAAAGRDGVTWVPDYRMPPRHPYPAALDDIIAVYRAALRHRPASQIVVSGTSAGGNLAAALMLRAEDEGLPLPAAVVLLTPEVDLTESGDTFRTLMGIDMLDSLRTVNELYAAGADLAHPYLSPLFGDVTGWPPTFLQSGTRDLFLSNTVRLHRKLLAAAVPVELHVFEAMPHGSFGGRTPEDDELRDHVRRFERKHLGSV
ncbi:alpha/beta hydrolase [Microbacterium sp. W4I20]|uniref:alpha/beta hydrolase n=1 Tax=Microbacterium sp. W4I20 TaxID=3042262 RepID=UPI00277E1BC3|nr:alpha/beta hydrolase [Microbacterium sp. W4I20]MDQ0727954.1 monoterpene epsilon-lactone hydrolase [Microbacterium sp. W4I20]